MENKIGIRSLSLGINQLSIDKEKLEDILSVFSSESDIVLRNGGRDTRTKRVVLSPMSPGSNLDFLGIMSYVSWISDFTNRHGFRWFNLPINKVNKANKDQVSDIGIECLKRYKNAFLNIDVIQENRINITAVDIGANLILSAAKLSNNGFDNFRLGISCGTKANTPFFPFTHNDKEKGFSIALELPQFINVFMEEHDKLNLIQLREALLNAIVKELREIQELAKVIESKTRVPYLGIDLSLAPYPEKNGSVGELIEKIINGKFGGHGTVFAISFFTDILKYISESSDIRTIGFNGVMLSLLEDEVISRTNKWKLFNLDSLLSYSAICGCGIDMVPLPGDIQREELVALILDVSAMSIRLNKPLGVRLLPIFGKSENEYTDYNFDFIYNSRVLGTKGIPSDFSLLKDKVEEFSFLKKNYNLHL